jgi:flagellar biosynthesis GTPase FlhF
VLPGGWPEHRKKVFKIAIAIGFFIVIGVYWLITGEKFDETAYRLVLCKVYQFERCLSVEREASQNDTSQQIARQAEALIKAAEEIRREQQEAAARRANEDRERAERQRAADEARKQEEALDALRQREATADTAMDNAFKFWRQGNFKVAAEYSENAIKIFTGLPNSGDDRIRNKIAEAHAIVGLGLALLGATPKDKAYGCGRLSAARKIYFEVGNTPMVSRTDQDLQRGGCRYQ